jgi:hypothetical protein
VYSPEYSKRTRWLSAKQEQVMVLHRQPELGLEPVQIQIRLQERAKGKAPVPELEQELEAAPP